MQRPSARCFQRWPPAAPVISTAMRRSSRITVSSVTDRREQAEGEARLDVDPTGDPHPRHRAGKPESEIRRVTAEDVATACPRRSPARSHQKQSKRKAWVAQAASGKSITTDDAAGTAKTKHDRKPDRRVHLLPIGGKALTRQKPTRHIIRHDVDHGPSTHARGSRYIRQRQGRDAVEARGQGVAAIRRAWRGNGSKPPAS